MLGYAISFFILALIAGFFGFWVLAGLATEIAQILCLMFVVLTILSLTTGPRAGSSTRTGSMLGRGQSK